MAVQAQYPSNAFSPDFRSRAQNNVLEELQKLQESDNHIGNLLGAYNNHLAGPQIFNNGTVFSDLQSELTCNASGPRKRNREESSMVLPQQYQNLQLPNQFRYPNLTVFPVKALGDATISTAVPMPHVQSRLFDSAATSTSGRLSAAAASTPVASPLAQDLVSHLYHQNIEIEALIRHQSEKLRSGLEEARKRHCRALISVLEQQVVKRLKEKETELENANRRNAELEEKVRQMSAENQIWFNVAKNNEAIVSSLKTSLEQVLLQNIVAAAANAVPAREGYGDSERTPFPADDAQSCCFEDEDRERSDAVVAEAVSKENEELRCRRACKACREKDVSVLLLPCRHLCLCKVCESKVDTCPICHAPKNACLQIFMS